MDQDILIIHQHRLMLDMLEMGLKKQLPQLNIATQLSIDSAKTTQESKLVLIDIEQLNKVSFRNLGPLVNRHPGARIVVLGSHARPEVLLARGVHTVIDLNHSLDDTVKRVESILAGRGNGLMVCNDFEQSSSSIFDCLSERERLVLRELCCGLKSVNIATKLDISPQTVHSYVSRICTKLNVETRQESVFLGMRHFEALQAI